VPLGRGVTWYTGRIQAITTVIPERAHSLAAAQAAGLAAGAVRSKGTGALARDLSRPQKVGPMHSMIGSDLPYAGMEHHGGVIVPRRAKRLLIRGTRGGVTRSTVGGEVVASATQVTHPAKRWGDAAVRAFPGLYLLALRRLMPG
jgi:hypothetical protein